MTSEFERALRQCDSEPVHIPGTIQPNGALLAFDLSLQHVRKASANLEAFLGVSADAALGQSAAGLLGPHTTRRIARSLESSDAFTPLSMERVLNGRRIRLQITLYCSDDSVVLELERLPAANQRRWLAAVNVWLTRLVNTESQGELLNQLVRGVHDLTRFERVMVYQFDQDWHGTVIAEYCRNDETPRFLNHRFPASDIPPQVRAIYLVNPIRSIPDAGAEPVPLIPRETASTDRLDITGGVLRAVSPIHLHYMRNMQVAASLSIAICGAEGLWGLVACHGTHPSTLPPPARDAALSLVQVATQRLFLLRARADSRYFQRVLDSRELISEKRGKLVTPEQLVEEHGDEWLGLFRACGLALLYREGISRCGHTPSDGVLKRIASRLTASHTSHGPWFSHALGQTRLSEAGDLEDCHGLLALPLDIDSPPGWLLFFRPEQVTTHQWAGDVNAPAILNEDKKTLSPRSSFDTWVEQVKGQSREWTAIEQQAAADLAEDLAVAASAHRIERLNSRLEEANRHLSELAQTDALTQVWNRYRMEQALDLEIAAASRYERPCSVILLDIDHFKQFNDNYGHEAGDKVLTTVAREIESGLRSTDQLGRWGGEEFIILAANSGLEESMQLAERLRSSIAALSLGELGQVTFSAGLAEWRAGDNRRSLVDRADQAMYRAKNAGRNQVCHD